MSEENLKVVITGDASGLDQAGKQATAALNDVSKSAADFQAKADAMNRSINYTDRSFKGPLKSFEVFKKSATDAAAATEAVSGSGIRAQYALSGIERAVRGNGIQGYVFGLQQTAREFGYLVTQTGSLKGGFAALGAALTGPAGFIIGASLVTELVSALIKKYGSLSSAIEHLTGTWTQADQAHQDFLEALKNSEKPFTTAVTNVNELQTQMGLANKGLLSQKTVLDNYNKTLGTAFGKANSLAEAEKALTAGSSAYIQATLNKAIATAFFQKASDAVIKSVEEQSKSASESATFWQKTVSFLSAGFSSANRTWGQVFKQYDQGVNDFAASNKRLAQLTGQNDFEKFSKDAQKYLTQAAQAFKGVFNETQIKSTGKTIQSVLKDMNEALKGIDLKQATGEIGYLDAATEKLRVYTKALQDLGALGAKPTAKDIEEITRQISILKGQLVQALPTNLRDKQFLKVVQGNNASDVFQPNPVPQNGLNPNINGSKILNLNPSSNDKLKQAQKDYNNELRNELRLGEQLDSVFQDVFSTMANGGNALQGLIQAIEQLIIKLAAAAAAAALLNVLTGGGAAGFGAIFGQLSGLTGLIPSHAQGGYIPGPQLAVVGDAPGGEWVLNQKQISAILNGSGGGRNVNVTGEFRLQGSDLVAVVDKNTRKQNRRG